MFTKISSCQHKIRQLQKIFYEIYIKRDYLSKIFYYEKKINKQSVKILGALKCLQTSTHYAKMVDAYDATLAMGQLRYRVKDYSTFAIIEPELKALSIASHHDFPKCIETLESIFNHTLSVAAGDPVMFLLFIDALKDLRQLNDI